MSPESLESSSAFIGARMHGWALENRINLGYDAACRFADKFHYYIVEYESDRHNHAWWEVHEWCSNNFGRENYSWAGNTFAFKTDEHRIMFKLRWG